MIREDKYEYAQYLDEQISNELRKLDKDKVRLNSLLSNYIEVIIDLSMDISKTANLKLDNTDNSVSKKNFSNNIQNSL